MVRYDTVRLIRDRLEALAGDDEDAGRVMAHVPGEAELVLLGEASHGSEEFYRLRADVTRRLIERRDVAAVAVEADWPDAYRLNRFVRGRSDETACEAFGDFERFPRWMWRNHAVLDFVTWLRGWNEARPPERRVGFYGIDLYSLHRSIDAVVSYLEEIDPGEAERARERYGCFERYGRDPQQYGLAAGFGLDRGCEEAVLGQLLALRRRREDHLARDGLLREDEQFSAERNAVVAAEAEKYYRAMYHGRPDSWNLRDRHMADTADALLEHLRRRWPGGRLAIWAHNSHIGDASATDVAEQGQWNIGQLLRGRHPGRCCLTGFTTYQGTVSAASSWGGEVERKRVLPGRPGGVEDLLHRCGGDFVLPLDRCGPGTGLHDRLLERFIGVIYRPETELASHYYGAHLARQYDLAIHLDRTTALEPFERTPQWLRGAVPETWPHGV